MKRTLPDMTHPYTTRTARYVALSLAALAVWGLSTCAEARPGDKRPADGLCEWRSPGASRSMQPLDQAVDRLDYIPSDVRAVLKQRLLDPRKHVAADDHILMTRDGVTGEAGSWTVRDMNGGQGEVCWGEVTRATWRPGQAERALVFCEQGWCVAYFSVCRNIASAVLVEPRRPAPGMRAAMPFGIDEAWTDVAQLDLVPVSVRISKPPQPPEEDVVERLWWPEGDWPARPFGLTGPAVVTPIPEPSTLAMLALGLACIVVARRFT